MPLFLCRRRIEESKRDAFPVDLRVLDQVPDLIRDLLHQNAKIHYGFLLRVPRFLMQRPKDPGLASLWSTEWCEPAKLQNP